MSENLNLGQIIAGEQHRDAIHIAVAPVTATQSVQPGEHVGFIGDTVSPEAERLIGVVDPFLREAVAVGERFWLFLYPGSITALRHEWTHPAFAAAPAPVAATPDKSVSEQWLRDFAERSDCPGYFELMGVAARFCDEGGDYSDEYLHFSGQDAHGDIPPEFWTHFEIVTGKKPIGEKPTFFSCSC